MNLRYEKATHGITVGTTVSMFSGGRQFLGVVRELDSFEGSGLVTEGALLRVEGTGWPYDWVGSGAVTVIGKVAPMNRSAYWPRPLHPYHAALQADQQYSEAIRVIQPGANRWTMRPSTRVDPAVRDAYATKLYLDLQLHIFMNRTAP